MSTDARTTLETLLKCIADYDPRWALFEAVPAGELRHALNVAIPLMPKPAPKRCTRTIDMFEVHP